MSWRYCRNGKKEKRVGDIVFGGGVVVVVYRRGVI